MHKKRQRSQIGHAVCLYPSTTAVPYSSAAPEGNWNQSQCSDMMIFNVQTTANIKFNSSYTKGHVLSIWGGGGMMLGDLTAKLPLLIEVAQLNPHIL